MNPLYLKLISHDKLKKVLLVILSLLSISGSQPYLFNHQENSTLAGRQAVYVKSNGWHTGFIVPAKAIQTYLPELTARFGNTPYLEIGWGDKGFYQAKEITTGLTLEAMFWSSGSVIHAVAVPEKIEQYFPKSVIEKLCLNDKDYAALMRFIAGSFYKNETGKIVALKQGIYGNSQFYEGVGTYHLLNTCNKWTAKGLESTRMNIYPAFKLTSGSVMNYIKEYKHSLRLDSSKNLKAELLSLCNSQ